MGQRPPRVHQPQRLFHPDGWAAGELDLVLRWDGKVRLIDIKSGNPNSKFAISGASAQFYAWLWHETHDNQQVDGIEGWYLDGPDRVYFPVPGEDKINQLTIEYKSIHQDMLSLGEGPVRFLIRIQNLVTMQQVVFGVCLVRKIAFKDLNTLSK